MELKIDVIYQLQDMIRERVARVLKDQGELFPQQVYLHPMKVMGVEVPCYSADDGKGKCHYVGVLVTTDRGDDKPANGTYTLYFCITADTAQPHSEEPWGYKWTLTPDFESENVGEEITRVRDYVLNFLVTGTVPADLEKLH